MPTLSISVALEIHLVVLQDFINTYVALRNKAAPINISNASRNSAIEIHITG